MTKFTTEQLTDETDIGTCAATPTADAFERALEALRKCYSDKAALITACDAALDWADQNARAFTIETAPKQGAFLAWSEAEEDWIHFETVLEYEYFKAAGNEHFTHWTPLPPPPSNPPLPAPLKALGEVLRRVKGV